MDTIQLINNDLLVGLHAKARESERKRICFDLRNSPNDNSLRMLNVLEPGTIVPIHRHIDTSESIICLEGCIDWIFYERLNPSSQEELYMNADMADSFKEIARFRICPQKHCFGIQVPPMTWHSIHVYEPTTIIEAKDGAYQHS